MIPDLSFVIPARNAEAWLAETIGSCIGQMYKGIEIIVVDDASEDSTRRIMDWYASKEPRVKPVYCRGAGNRGAARNAGIAQATAPILAMLDADDLCSQDRARETLRAFSNGIEWVCSGAEIIDSISEPIGQRLEPGIPTLARLLDTGLAHIVHSTMAMRATICKTYPYDEGEYQAVGLDDWHLQTRLLADGAALAYIPRILVGWRQHVSNTVSTRNPETVKALKDKFLEGFRAKTVA